MKNLCIAITALFLLTAVTVKAQGTISGTVYDGNSNNKLPNVFVQNITSNQTSLTDKNGKFEIKGAPGNLLVFTLPTYDADTVYITNMSAQKIRLTSQSIALGQVDINATRKTFDPRTEYPKVYEDAKVYPLSPSSWFGKDARNARRLKKYLEREAKERRIDSAFNQVLITSIIPLKGPELEDFMTIYRPEYEFVEKSDTELMKLYINDSYKKFKALPPEKRKVQALPEAE